MANGYVGKLLDVDLTKGALKDYPLTDEMCSSYIGGYGFGAKILYERMKPGVDPLGPDNILGLLTGPMTGTPCIEGNRFVAVCKSPLTGTRGDANCGGNFGRVTVDLNTLAQDYLKALDWDTRTTVPSNKKLEWLGLGAVAKDLKPVA